jgi:hypothetical protein
MEAQQRRNGRNWSISYITVTRVQYVEFVGVCARIMIGDLVHILLPGGGALIAAELDRFMETAGLKTALDQTIHQTKQLTYLS